MSKIKAIFAPRERISGISQESRSPAADELGLVEQHQVARLRRISIWQSAMVRRARLAAAVALPAAAS